MKNSSLTTKFFSREAMKCNLFKGLISLLFLFSINENLEAQVTPLQNWQKIYTRPVNTGGTNINNSISYPISDGPNRLLVVAISAGGPNGGVPSPTVTWGGVSLTASAANTNSSNRAHSFIFYLTESGISSANSNTLTVNMGNISYYGYITYVAVYKNVNQTTPVRNGKNPDISTDRLLIASTTADFTAGDQGVFVTGFSRNGDDQTVAYASVSTGWSGSSDLFGGNTSTSVVVGPYYGGIGVRNSLSQATGETVSMSITTYDPSVATANLGLRPSINIISIVPATPRYFKSNNASGNWATASHWLVSSTLTGTYTTSASTPTEIDYVTVQNGHTVTLGSASGADTLIVEAGGVLNLSNVGLGVNTLIMHCDGSTSGASMTGSGTLTLGGDITILDNNNGSNGATISCPIQLDANRTITVVDGQSSPDLIISGSIGGAFSITKSGNGTMVLSGANSYTGTTTVSAGALNIQNATALGTTANGTVVSSGAQLQIQGGITVGAETLSLAGTGISTTGALRNISGVNTFGGLLTLTASTEITSDAGSLAISNGGTITGATFSLTLNGAGDGSIASIIGTTSGGIVKAGAGTWTLSGANTYTGATSISAGALNIQNATALGTTANGTVVSSGAQLQIQGGINVGAEALTLSGTGISATGALRNISGTNTYGGLITLAGATEISSDAGSLAISNTGTIIDGTFSLTLDGAGDGSVTSIIGTTTSGVTKDGAGTWTLSGLNTYSGSTTVNAGTLKAGVATSSSNGAFGNGSAVIMANTAGATLDITGYNNTIGSLTGGGTTGGNVTLGAATLTIGSDNTSPAAYAGVLSGSGGITKTGTGVLTLSGANTYSGLTSVSDGRLNIQHATALGSTSGGTTVSSGAALQIQGGITVGTETLTISGAGPDGNAAFDNVSGSNIWGGSIILGAAATIRNQSATMTINNANAIDLKGYQLTLGGSTTGGSGIISGVISSSSVATGSLRKVTGGGVWTLSGVNTFTGGVTLQAGQLNLNNSQALGTASSTLTISTNTDIVIDNTSSSDITTLNHPISISQDFTFAGTKNLNLGNGNVTMDASRSIAVNAGTLTLGGSINHSSFNLTKTGSGTLSFGSNAVSLNSLVISAGNLISTLGNLTLGGDFTNNGTFTHNSGTVILSGSGSASTIGGSSSITLNNLTLNGQNASKTQTLTRNVSVIGTLTLTKGTLVSSASSLLTIENGGSITGYSDDGLIEGALKRVGTGSSPYAVVFPLKGKTYLQAVTITYGSASSQDAFTVSYVGNAHANRGNKQLNIDNVSDKEYWDITPTWGAGSTNETNGVQVDIVYRSPAGKYFTGKDKGLYRIGHYTGTEWEIPSTGYAISHTTNDDGISGTLSLQGVKSFSPFTPVSGLDASALPVKLAAFTAKKTVNNAVALSWLTTSESMNKGFRIERQSANLSSKFEQIGYVPTKAPMGTSQGRLSYSFMDKNVRAGETVMYRLVQEDLDGTLTSSEVRMIRVDGHSVVFLYPNPSTGNVVVSRTDYGKKMNIQVYDQSGRIVQQAYHITGPTYSFTLGISGTYMIKLTHPETGEQSIQRIVIQK